MLQAILHANVCVYVCTGIHAKLHYAKRLATWMLKHPLLQHHNITCILCVISAFSKMGIVCLIFAVLVHWQWLVQ